MHIELGEDIAPASLFTDILAEIMEQFSQLNLGTIDSLFQRIARALCTELGLARLTPLDPLDEQSRRRHALDLTYEQLQLQAPSEQDQEQDQLLQEAIVECLDHPSELSRADSRIFERVNSYHEIMLASPHALWGGDPDSLSAEQLALFGLSPEDLHISQSEVAWRAQVAALIRLFEQDEHKTLFPEPAKDPENKGSYIFAQRAGAVTMHHSTARVYRNKFLRYLRSLHSLQSGLEPVEVKEMPDATPHQQAASRYAPYWSICRERGYDLDELIHDRNAHIWRGLLKRTRALHDLLARVEHNYEANVREQGLYSFSDIARLLQGQFDEQSYSLVQERLDAQLQHWLLDEFQDTSHEQYTILRDLLLARAQEGDEGSVFMVGDAKQSIYAFRGGDPQIFLGARDELFGLNQPEQHRSQEKPLNCSYRSSQSVLDLVNALFGEALPTYAPRASARTHQLWEQLHFTPHSAHRPAETYPGSAEIWRMHKKADELEGKEIAYHFIAEQLERIRPLAAQQHGLPLPSCAILVSTSSEGLRLYEALQELQSQYPYAGPLVYNGDRAVGRDAPLGLALMQLFTWLQTPADTQSRDLLQLSPLWSAVQALGGKYIWQTLRERVATSGISQLLRELSRADQHDFITDEQHLKSWRIWIDEAAAFDERGGSLQDWIERIDQLRLRDESQGHGINIMTIHKSKGLEFDMVFLPLLSTRDQLASYGKKKILQHQGAHGETYAALLLPSDEDWAREQEQLYTLMVEPWRAQEECASLCALYVALTRAKRASYIILPPAPASPPKNESFKSIINTFIEHAPTPAAASNAPMSSELATCEYCLGDPYWYEEITEQPPAAAPVTESPELLAPQYSFSSLPRRTPSSLDAQKTTPSSSPAALQNNSHAIELGNSIHAVMQHLDWLTSTEQSRHATLRDQLPAELHAPEDIIALLERALHCEAWKPHFQRPSSPHRLYREQNIEALTRGSWVSGQIDRLVVFYDEGGTRPLSAHIYDYKSNADARELKAHYREQMRAYRHLCALAFQLPESQVSVTLLHCPRQGEAGAYSYEASDWRG